MKPAASKIITPRPPNTMRPRVVVPLPLGVDVSKADADYKDGFLTVILPKFKPASIKITG